MIKGNRKYSSDCTCTVTHACWHLIAHTYAHIHTKTHFHMTYVEIYTDYYRFVIATSCNLQYHLVPLSLHLHRCTMHVEVTGVLLA